MAKSNVISVSRYFLIIFLILVFLAGFYFIFWTGSPTINKVTSIINTNITPSNDDENNNNSNNNEDDQSDDIEEKKLTQSELDNCPDVLIRRGNVLLLINSKMPEVPGTNPIVFNTLDDYIYYIKVQRYKYGKYCPVLFLQQETNAQGQDIYRMRPGPFDQQGGLPTTSYMNQSQIAGVLGKYANPSMSAQMGPYAFNQSGPNAISLSVSGTPVNYLTQNNTIAHPPQVPYIDANRDDKPYNQGYYGFDPYGQYVGKYTVLDKIHDSTQKQNPTTGLSNNPMDPNWGGIVFTNKQVMSNTFSDDELTNKYKSGILNQTPGELVGTPISSPNSNNASDLISGDDTVDADEKVGTA